MKKTLVLVLAAIMVLGVAGAAFAEVLTPTSTEVVTGNPSKWTASGVVNISAKINEKLSMTVGVASDTNEDGILNLTWDVTPGGTDPIAQPVVVKVSSNKTYLVSRTDVVTGITGAGMGVTATSLPSGPQAKGDGVVAGDADNVYTDNVNLTATDWWQVTPGSYTGTLTYTAVQQ